jgi:tetratricopeptide (TPR) repeat protein
MAAIAAFRNRHSDALDEGPPTAHRVLAQAEAMAAAGNAGGALILLREHHAHSSLVPPEYESAISRLSHATRDREAEVARLRSEFQSSAETVQTKSIVALGAALYELGRPQQAGEAFSQAITAGARDLPLSHLILADEHRLRIGSPDAIETSFSKPVTLVDATRKIAYVAVPKNASSLLKANFILNSSFRADYLAERGNIHDFSRGIADVPFDRNEILRPAYIRFTVLRDPHRRLLSAYLQKFVRRWRNRAGYLRGGKIESTMRGAQSMCGLPFDPVRSISFEEFVRFLATIPDSECNSHWQPQVRLVGSDLSLSSHRQGRKPRGNLVIPATAARLRA